MISTGTFLERIAPRIMDMSGMELAGPGLYTFLNPHTYMMHRGTDLPLETFRGIFVDGLTLVAALRATGVKRVRRCSFDMGSLAPRVFSFAQERGRSLFLIGTEPDLIPKAVMNIREEYPDVDLVGYRHGYFTGKGERKKVAQAIAGEAPDMVVVGMGAPLQERFLLDLREAGWEGTGFTCGGFLHQAAVRLRYYPSLANRLQLRWVVRMSREPKIVVRVLRYYPPFLLAFLRDVRSLPHGRSTQGDRDPTREG